MIYNMSLFFHFINSDILSHIHKCNLKLIRKLHNKPIILGIESSCDDTAFGIVDSNGNILGESINSQYLTHLNFGGIIPTFARSLHVNNITKTCEDALRAANLRIRDIDAIATTVKPGLPMSLNIGTQFGKYLAKIGGKPFIPIHHMEAHALTARINKKIDFPYLALLISGGHCLLAIVENVNKFYLLGTSLSNTPGDVFNKVARRLKLRNIPEFSTLNGGQAIELAATFQLALTTHICQRTQRAMEFINKMSLFPENKQTLVISGGVACNNFLAKALNIVSTELGYTFVRTPSKLCTDNGIMIAWNGVEKWIQNIDVIRDINEIEKIEAEKVATLGENWIKKVEEANLKCKWVKIKKKLF
ncbi:probable tRNA N6-adenosine threonylcarbamoyltransferase, mitochondrial isoform X2 [Apis mellifera]|uniref:N(6)-L-threonylcarbamoyladenine synthase n=1 Tax=Apis mellifera TaxID=7460 RepID=A0A7M7MVU4_APIME|nr:probable tRNA N6-adenosine threonylcarbamoyltransferase, mitochondrial isoform X2 [Apis mellifera]|eukprot:XP_026301725.1 probable tRNA N6-adenosine threonylcarbamoyltransferase, mitochondrial isoform X2 [Apis mellifera]